MEENVSPFRPSIRVIAAVLVGIVSAAGGYALITLTSVLQSNQETNSVLLFCVIGGSIFTIGTYFALGRLEQKSTQSKGRTS